VPIVTRFNLRGKLKVDAITQARQIAAELESKLAAASDRATALATDRRRLAYAASTDDTKAHRELTKLTGESAVVAIDVENCHAALIEARHRLDSAEAAAALAERKANAERLSGQVKELAAKIESRGPAIAAGLAAVAAAFTGLQNDLRAVKDLDAELVPARLVELAFAEAVSSTLRSVGIVLGDTVPPDRRRTPEALTAGYATRANTLADAILNEKAAA
jgi:hypothetical protein